jgi:hypothetical protein
VTFNRRPGARNNRGRIATGGPPGPATILGANNFLWYKASLGITLNGGDVAAWANQGTGGAVNLVQATAGQQPLYVASAQNGKPCVRFTRANTDLLSVASGAPSQMGAHSIFLVGTFTTTAASFRGMCGIGDNVKSSGIGHNGSTQAWFGGANLGSPSGAAVAAATVYRLGKTVAAESAGTSATQGYRNGAADGAPNANAYGTSTAFSVGNYESGTTGCGDVDIYEILVPNIVMSAGQIADINTYLGAEYAL